MKTTNDEFSLNSLRWVPRQLAKVLAAAAVLLAAGLPIALANEAGATTAPTVSTLFFSTTLGGSNNGLPGVGAGASIYVGITGTGFAYDGANNVTLTTTAPGVTFLQVKELSTTTAEAAIVTSGTTPAGTYPVTLTDSNGSGTSATSILTIDPAPTASGLDSTSALSIPSGNPTPVTVVVDGTGFDCLSYNSTLPSPPFTNPSTSQSCVSNSSSFAAGKPSVTVTNVSTGVSLEIGNTGGIQTVSVGGTTGAENGTSLSFTVYGNNVNTGNAAAPAGTYSVNVLNPDQGSVSLVGVFTVTASGITSVSPSQVAATNSTATNLTITGAGFQPGATVSTTTPTSAHGSFSNTVVVSSTTITTTYTTGSAASTETLPITVTNQPSPGNGAVITLANALGVGEPSLVAPSVTSTSVSPATPIVVGSTGITPVTLTITGTGFGSGSTVEAFTAAGTQDTNVTFTNTVNSAGTTLTSAVTVATGAIAGADTIEVGNTGHYSAPSATAFTVAGPVITSASPTSLAAGAAVGTVITFTGTGFNSTATATLAGFGGVFAVTSPTTATFALTSVAPAAGTHALVVTETVSAGNTVVSASYNYTTNAPPTIGSSPGFKNANTGGIYVGAGGVAVPVTITGTGFASGATVGAFKNAYGVADPGVTATVTKVTSTVIYATVTVAANDANVSDGFTVTNLDGGTATIAGFATGALYISAPPTITAVTPANAAGSSTNSFTITGTGFASGAVVTTSPANGTCGVTKVVSSSSLTVTCSFGAAGTSATSLLVTNLDGGSATSAPIVPAATPVAAPTPYTSGTSGTAKVGTTQTIVVSGGGFYAQPKVTSTGAGIKAVVSGDTGTALTVQVTVTKNTPGWHTLTFTLANGSVFKANYLIKK